MGRDRDVVHRSTALPVISCLAAAALFGASTPVAKTLLNDLGPFSLAGLLYLGGAVAVLPFSFRGGSAELRRDPRQLRMLALAVLFGGALGPLLLLLGLRAAPAASVSLWLNTETVATALLAWLVFHEHLDRRTVLAMALVLAGGILLAATGGSAGWRAGALVALACACWGLDNNLTALVSAFTPAQTTAIKGLGAGGMNLAMGLAFEGRPHSLGITAAAAAVGALGYGVSIMLYIAGAQQLGASRSQLVFSTSPFLGVLVAWSVLDEPVRSAQIAAAVSMALGLVILLTARHAHEHSHGALVHVHRHRHDDGHHTHVHPGLPAHAWHTHPHEHTPMRHSHVHLPDLHHRHDH